MKTGSVALVCACAGSAAANADLAIPDSLNKTEWEGEMVFLAFWALWCTPCLPSLPVVADLARQSVAVEKLRVLSVHVTERYGAYDSAQHYLDHKELDIPLAVDKDGDFHRSFFERGNANLPYYVLLGPDGAVKHTSSKLDRLETLAFAKHINSFATEI